MQQRIYEIVIQPQIITSVKIQYVLIKCSSSAHHVVDNALVFEQEVIKEKLKILVFSTL